VTLVPQEEAVMAKARKSAKKDRWAESSSSKALQKYQSMRDSSAHRRASASARVAPRQSVALLSFKTCRHPAAMMISGWN